MTSDRTGLLFLCMGNICRSPLAEGIFLHAARERGVADRFDVDSCGTGGWHAGEKPDPRARAVAKKRGVDLPSRARKLDPSADAARFDLVLAMDASNHADAISAGIPAEKVRLMREFDPTLDRPADVPDPYYGGQEGFEDVFEMLTRACQGLLDHCLRDDHKSGG